MTHEQLTQARVQEAMRTVGITWAKGPSADYGAEVALAMARLIEEEWKPEPPVNPLLIQAREIAERHVYRGCYTDGSNDGAAIITALVEALSR